MKHKKQTKFIFEVRRFGIGSYELPEELAKLPDTKATVDHAKLAPFPGFLGIVAIITTTAALVNIADILYKHLRRKSKEKKAKTYLVYQEGENSIFWYKSKDKSIYLNGLPRESLVKLLRLIAEDRVSKSANEIIELIIPALESSEEQTLDCALKSFSHFGRRPHLKHVLPYLQDESATVRSTALRCLAHLGAPYDYKHALSLLRDENEHVCISAIVTLRRLAKEKVDSQLLSTLRELANSKDPYSRMCAADELGYIRNEESLALLLMLADDPESNVRSSAATSLGRLKYRPAKQKLIELLKSDKYYGVCRAAVLALMRVRLSSSEKKKLRDILAGYSGMLDSEVLDLRKKHGI